MINAHFPLPLRVELTAYEPRPTWRLIDPFSFIPKRGNPVICPSGFVTDFASVPRLPLMFLLAGDTCHKAAVIHDYLYSYPNNRTRAQCDKLLRDACKYSGVRFWRRWMVWAGVRVGGRSNFKREG